MAFNERNNQERKKQMKKASVLSGSYIRQFYGCSDQFVALSDFEREARPPLPKGFSAKGNQLLEGEQPLAEIENGLGFYFEAYSKEQALAIHAWLGMKLLDSSSSFQLFPDCPKCKRPTLSQNLNGIFCSDPVCSAHYEDQSKTIKKAQKK